MKADLRSDTVTRPTPAMLEAMFSAGVGDDVFGEDPTVNALEEKAAAMFGMEAGLYCPSGTMTNQAAMRTHLKPGDEVMCQADAHIYRYEGGGIPANSGASVKLVEGYRGKMSPEDIPANINNPEDHHCPLTRLVAVENTSNMGGGSVYSIGEMAAISGMARENGLKVHLDGARIFNALVALGESSSALTNLFDSISVCLSKGLGAPMGSLLLGSGDFIRSARRMRKLMGGGMRQAGYMAAAGIFALDHHIDRLQEDHVRAGELGKTLEGLPFVEEVMPVETNIVIFRLVEECPVKSFLENLEERNIFAVSLGPQTVRMVTHLDFDDDMLQRTIEVLAGYRIYT